MPIQAKTLFMRLMNLHEGRKTRLWNFSEACVVRMDVTEVTGKDNSS